MLGVSAQPLPWCPCPPLCSGNPLTLRCPVFRSCVVLWGGGLGSVLKVTFCKGGHRVPRRPCSRDLGLTVRRPGRGGSHPARASALGPGPYPAPTPGLGVSLLLRFDAGPAALPGLSLFCWYLWAHGTPWWSWQRLRPGGFQAVPVVCGNSSQTLGSHVATPL